MSDVASLLLCKELYELSGWEDTRDFWVCDPENENANEWIVSDVYEVEMPMDLPAYDLGYLLRKLPAHYSDQWLRIAPITDDKWSAYYIQSGVKTAGQDEWADTPEDALCKLAIKLLKQGILPTNKDKETI